LSEFAGLANNLEPKPGCIGVGGLTILALSRERRESHTSIAGNDVRRSSVCSAVLCRPDSLLGACLGHLRRYAEPNEAFQLRRRFRRIDASGSTDQVATNLDRREYEAPRKSPPA